MSQTLLTAAKWAKQHEAYGPGWTENYWRTREDPSRVAVVEALTTLPPWTTLVEIGCNAGPQLHLIAKTFLGKQLYGIDVNPVALQAGRQNVSSATFTEASLWEWLPLQTGRAWDVLISHYTLAYVAPEDLSAILAQCLRVAKCGLVLAEPTALPGAPLGLVWSYPEWRHPYMETLESLGAQVV